MIILYILIITLALWGFFLSLHINKKKRSNKPMVCPLGADCKTVITGEFSSFLGIGLEIFGALYYAIITIVYLFILISPDLVTDLMIFILTGFTIGAFLFSLYLTFIQAVYIKSWCSWCLTSAAISTLIFVLTLITIVMKEVSFIPILSDLQTIILVGHLFGFALGVGGTTICGVLFFKFLRDFKITHSENNILKILSQIVWVGLFIVVITGIGLYMPESDTLKESSRFLVEVIAISVVIISSTFLNLLVLPKLINMSFGECLNVGMAHNFRKFSFILGSISFVSWYIAFILGTINDISFSFNIVLITYIILLILGIILGQIIEHFYCTKRSRSIH